MGEGVHAFGGFYWAPLCCKPWESRCEYSSLTGPLFSLEGVVATLLAALHMEGAGDPLLRVRWVHVVHGFLYSD